MAKLTINDEIQDMLKNGAEMAPNGFKDKDGNAIAVRSMEATTDPLEVGDVITVPNDYQVILYPIGENKYPCTVVEVKSTDGSTRNMRFFPNSLAKNITPIDENEKRLAKVKTSGTVATWYQDQGTVDRAMEGLKGRSFKVTSANSYTIKNYQTKQNQNTRIYSYDWV